MKRENIVIFASGNGSNAENIIKYFSDHPRIGVSLVVATNPKAKVIERARTLDVDVLVISKKSFDVGGSVLGVLKSMDTRLIVLAGFLWLLPSLYVDNFPNSIINIHPSLLPKYGGKGMYGMNVHQAVIEAGEKESGITIHYVNNKYDEGQIIFQKQLSIAEDETPQSLAHRIHELEFQYFPVIIEQIVDNN